MLIVDDEKSLRDMLQLLFHKQGFEVSTAANYTEGVAAAIRSTPTSSSATSRCPTATAWTCCRKVRAESLPTPVIMITAHTSTEDAIQALKRGAVDYISKPFNNDELVMIVQRALGEKQLQDENLYLRQELAGKYNFANIIGRGSPDAGDLPDDRAHRQGLHDRAPDGRERHGQGARSRGRSTSPRSARTRSSSRSTAARCPRRSSSPSSSATSGAPSRAPCGRSAASSRRPTAARSSSTRSPRRRRRCRSSCSAPSRRR